MWLQVKLGSVKYENSMKTPQSTQCQSWILSTWAQALFHKVEKENNRKSEYTKGGNTVQRSFIHHFTSSNARGVNYANQRARLNWREFEILAKALKGFSRASTQWHLLKIVPKMAGQIYNRCAEFYDLASLQKSCDSYVDQLTRDQLMSQLS